jgi:hypothetical protein
MSSLVNTLRRCHSTVCGLRKSRAAISGFGNPSRASRAICRSGPVKSSRVSTVRLRVFVDCGPELDSAANTPGALPWNPVREPGQHTGATSDQEAHFGWVFVELDTRQDAGYTISLEWDRDTDNTRVVVADRQTASLLVLPVPGANAGDAFRHPFRYAP